MQADTGLVYSSHNWRETLSTFHRIKDNISKLTLEPYPNERVLAACAKLAYSDCSGKPDLPKGWKLLTTARNKSWRNGYYGCAFWNPSEQQVVIAHRGTDPKKVGPLYADGKSVYFNKYTEHMFSAVTFADDIKEAILRINTHPESRFVLSFSGHSLGAWLAGVTTLTVKYLQRKGSGFCKIASPGDGLHAHTLALDSPGVEDMLIRICKDYDVRYDHSMCTKQLDITTFFAAPNVVNSTGRHVGDLLQIHTNRVALPGDSKEPTLTSNLETHNIDIFIEAFKDGKETYVVKNWPQGFSERKYYHRLEMFCNSYILRQDVAEVSPASSSGHQNTQPIEENAGSKHSEDTPTLQYSTIPSQGNTCHLGVFSAKELSFILNWSLFQSNTVMKLTKIEKFTNQLKLKNLNIPFFEIDTRKNTITCETKECLRKVIGQTKQLLRWFPAEITNAMARQNRTIKSAPLYLAGQAYLRTLPDILDCEDTLGLEAFLESSEHRILQIVTSDLKFEAARLYNIFKRIRNTTLDSVYFKENCQAFLSWNDLIGIAKDINIKVLNKSDVTSDNLLVLEIAFPTDNSHPNYKILRQIFNNLETCSHKKLVIIISHPIDWLNLMGCNLSVVTKPFKNFELIDLTSTSIDYILARDAIAFGEETLSLNTLLADDCKSDDEQVRNETNKLLSPILKNLATYDTYTTKISYKLLRLCELDALYSKGNKRVDKAKILALLERTGTDGPLLVISDPDQLSQEYWGEVAEAARGRIFTSEEDEQDLFLEKCRENSARVIYWLHLGVEGLNLNEVYNSGLYMPRKFHTRLIIKSVDALVRYSGNKDVFIFNDVEDKLTLISSFHLSKEAEDLFVSKDHFRIISRSHELNTGNKNKEELLNQHYFKMVEIRGTPYLVWQYSHGSLDGLRPFITRDCTDPMEEGAFSNSGKKLTIIADDPGMGKTTSLTRMSELIQGSWVLRIDHNHLATAIDKLHWKLNLKSVTKCLIHASGLSTDDDLLRSLLQHCLQSDSSRQVCILLDAFDEIVNEKNKMEKLLTYLKNATTCRIVVTTRVHPQEGLENELSEFCTTLEKITKGQQDDYMMNFWLPHLALELPEHGESEKGRLHQFARELREEVEGVLGEDVANFMGIPLQIRMLAEVFLQQAILSVMSPEQAMNLGKITNLFDLFKQFIEVKKSIYLEQKTNLNKDLPPTIKKEIITSIMEKHCVLAFQSIDPQFASEYFTNTIMSNQELKDIGRLGLLRANINGTFLFIHRTFEEYFCADFFVQWLRNGRKNNENSMLIKNVLCIFLLRPDHYIIRKFIETQLDISPPIPSAALEKNPILYQHWSEHRQLFLDDRVKIPLHIAAEEQNRHTFAVLLSGPSSRTFEEDFISFIAARDKTGMTALNMALENGNLNIVKQIMKNIESCSYEFFIKLMLATFLDKGSDRDEELLREYCSDTQLLTCASRAIGRTENIRKQIAAFMAAVRDNDYRTVEKILSGLETDTERSYLLIAIDSQGDTAINLATNKKDHTLFKLFAKQGVSVSYDNLEQNPLHCAAGEGHIAIVKYLLNQTKETYDSIEKISLIKYIQNITFYFPQQFFNYYNQTGEAAKQNNYFSITSPDKNGNTALILAAEKGHQEIVVILLQHGMDISCRNHYGLTALSLAARNGHHELVSALLQHGADINSIDNNSNTALIFSSEKGHRKVVNVLLQHGGDVHHRNLNGVNALLKAVFKGHQEVVISLLQHGADISCKNQFGFNALSLAAFKGHREIVNILLQHSADVNCENNYGNTALTFAAQKGHQAVVGILLQHGADINKRNNDGGTPLIIAAQKGYQEVIRTLLLHGVDINSRNVNGNTALMLTAGKGHQEVVSILLQHDADINARNSGGDTPLIIAAQKGHQVVVSALLQHGADMNAQNFIGGTPLIIAAQKNYREIVRTLLEHGVDINLRNVNGNTALMLTAGKGHHEVVNLLLQYGADIGLRNNTGNTALSFAASNDNLETLCKLLSHNGDNISSQNNKGNTALHWAAFRGHHEILCKLLEHGADIHLRSKSGWTAINIAAGYGHPEIVEPLILNGADLNSRDEDGDTPLLQAAANGHTEMVVLLLQRGVDVNSQRDDGRTALSWAALKGHVNVVEILLQRNADVSCQDKDGKTALFWAEEKGNREVIDLLRSHQEANPVE